MTNNLPRTSFHRSRLIHLLVDLLGRDSTESRPSFAEKLGQWLNLSDAIALSGALATAAAQPPSERPTLADGGPGRDLVRTRQALLDSIRADGTSAAARPRIRLPAAPTSPTADGEAGSTADFEPYRRYYAAHQREMESTIGHLRGRVRTALSAASPTLAALADLDAVMEKSLADHERGLLAHVPSLLEERYQTLRRATADAPTTALPADGWLPAFHRDLRAVLIAELELRLQPVTGLVDALCNKETIRQ